ncbi:MAG TPA: hypothetical protein H9825_10755 [Candidatus Sphingobacterium stercorigallinarum]|nr:hypothetical protein [Candidatus Sphingobacterium stercorigallinarum]
MNENKWIYNIRLTSLDRKNVDRTIASIKARWSAFVPVEKFDYQFYDATILALYKKGEQLQKITNISTAIAIFILGA